MGPSPHSHDFTAASAAAEKRTWIVVGLTATMMLVEIVGGWLFNSMAVLADGCKLTLADSLTVREGATLTIGAGATLAFWLRSAPPLAPEVSAPSVPPGQLAGAGVRVTAIAGQSYCARAKSPSEAMPEACVVVGVRAATAG